MKQFLLIFTLFFLTGIINAQDLIGPKGKINPGENNIEKAVERETALFDVVLPEKEKNNKFELSGYLIKEDDDEEYFVSMEEEYEVTKYEFSFNSDYTYEKYQKKEHNASVNFDYVLLPRIEAFLLSSWEYDKYNEIRYSYFYGAGGKLSIAKNKYWKTDLSYAPIYETEKYVELEEESHLKHSFRYRLLFYFMEPFTCGYAFWYVRRNEGDYRTEHIVKGKLEIGKPFFIKCNYKRIYNKFDNNRKTKIYAEIGIRL